MNLFNRKDGVVFTIIALVISSFILMMFFYMIELPIDHSVDVTRIKIHSINTFLSQSEDIIKAQAVASSKQSISSMIKIMYDENDFINGFDDKFRQCLETGEFNWGETHSCGEQANFKKEIEDDLALFLSENTGLNIQFLVSDFVLNQTSPWSLDIMFSLNMYLDEGDFGWNISSNLSESFSIVDFPDPVHVVVDNPLLPHRPNNLNDVTRIKLDEQYNNLSGLTERASTFNTLLIDKTYFEHNLAPSYLNRLKGNFAPSNLGIMTVVLPIYTAPNDYTSPPIRSGSSSMDWHFWQNRFDPSLNYGQYVFSEIEYKVEVLGLDQPYNLTNTIHNVIIPRSMASEANVSDSDYFNFI